MKHLLMIALILSFPAIAIAAPPPHAKPLSEIIQYIEARGDVGYFDEIEWDKDGELGHRVHPYGWQEG